MGRTSERRIKSGEKREYKVRVKERKKVEE